MNNINKIRKASNELKSYLEQTGFQINREMGEPHVLLEFLGKNVITIPETFTYTKENLEIKLHYEKEEKTNEICGSGYIYLYVDEKLVMSNVADLDTVSKVLGIIKKTFPSEVPPMSWLCRSLPILSIWLAIIASIVYILFLESIGEIVQFLSSQSQRIHNGASSLVVALMAGAIIYGQVRDNKNIRLVLLIILAACWILYLLTMKSPRVSEKIYY